MERRRSQADVAEPVVEGEQLHPAQPGPSPDRVVADRQQKAEQNLRGEDADGDETDDRGDVYRCWHRESAARRNRSSFVVRRASFSVRRASFWCWVRRPSFTATRRTNDERRTTNVRTTHAAPRTSNDERSDYGCASVVVFGGAFFTYLSNQLSRSARTCSSVSRAAYPCASFGGVT